MVAYCQELQRSNARCYRYMSVNLTGIHIYVYLLPEERETERNSCISRHTALRMAADFYDTLGIPRSASEKDIKTAFRQKARKYHPDVSDAPDAEEQFKKIAAAYEVLSNPETRQRYDQFGEAGLGAGFGSARGGGGQGFEVDLGDIFESFFGGGGGGGRGGGGGGRRNTGPVRGEDLRVDLDVSFKSACFGADEKVRIRHSEACTPCSGTGVKAGSKQRTCTMCRGQGVVMQVQQTPLGAFQTQTTCPQCRGTGQMVDEYCGECAGQGVVERSKQVKVKIPCGVDNDSKLRIKGEGDAGRRGGPPGDLYVFLSVKPDPKFKRKGRDIYSDIHVNYLDAILGNDKVPVETIDGSVTMEIQPGTQPDTTLRIRGKGAPQLNKIEARGDHYVKVRVDIPRSLSKDEAEIIKKLDNLRKSSKVNNI